MSPQFARVTTIVICLCALLAADARRAFAGGACCALCGKAENCDKVCRLVPTEKKITVTCWGCETEDICLPGASRPTCKHCEVACEGGEDDGCHCRSLYRKYFAWSEWTPCCHPWIPGSQPRIVTKKKLMKKTVTKTIPTYKWVVDDLCPSCEEQCETTTAADGVLIPPPPKLNDDVRILTLQPAPPAESR